MMWVITFIFVVVFYFYWNFIRPLSTWKQMNIPYIKGYPLVGNFLRASLKVESFADSINSLYEALPNEKYVGVFLFAKPQLMIRDADLLKQIGIIDFDNFTDHTRLFFGESFDSLFDKNVFSLKGQEWRDMRATLSPAFTGSKMRLTFTLINDCGHQLANYLNDKRNSEKESHLDVELRDLFTRFTNDVIASTAFGIKCDSLKEPENEFYLMGREIGYFSTIRLFCTNIFPRLMKFLKMGILPKYCCDYFRNLVNKTVEVRERQKILRPDMLNLLIQAKNGVLKNEIEENSGFTVADEGKLRGKVRKLTKDDVSAQAFLFFLAGFDTASTAMCFTVYELALNPDIQERLYSEIFKTFEGSNNGDVTYETLNKMKYLDMVISESLRKWPPAIIIDRQCTRPYQLRTDGKSVDIAVGTGILVPIYGIHRDPKYYPNPDKFDPERFNDENKCKINSNAYLPFGMGPRICLGKANLIIVLLTECGNKANYLCFGLRPVWWHVTNVLLHVICCILFTRVCLLIARMRPGFAALAGLLFAAHPIHTEAVTGIVGRADVLACVFFLISLLAYHGHIDGKCQIWASVALGGLSMLAKETGITVFVLNLAYDMYRCWPFIKRTFVEVRWNEETCQLARRAAKILMSLGVLLAVRLAILQGSLPKFSQQDNPTAFHPSLYVRLITFCYLAAFNWWLLLCPVTLSHDWQMGSIPLVTSYSDYRNIITCLFFGCALLLAYRCLMDFEQQRHIPLVLGVLLLILPFLPATNLFVTVGFVVAERVLYIPSMGGIMLTVYGMQLLWSSFIKHRQTLLCLAILLLAAGCLRTIARNRDWRSRESLLRSGLQTLPHNAKMHYNFANFLRDSLRTELAMTHYQKALQLWPTYASAHNNLGTLITNKFQAEKHFLLAIRFSSDHVNAHYNLGQLYRKSNRTMESARMLEKCIALEPTYTPAYLELARLRGMSDLRSGQLLKNVVQLHPRNANHLTLYGNWLRGQGRNLESLKYYWRALQISGTHKGAVTGTCRVLRTLGQRSRLLQLIARWQLIERSKRGEPLPFIGLHLYLRSYQLHAELSNKAKEYDSSCSCKICTNKCQQPKPTINIPVTETTQLNIEEPSSSVTRKSSQTLVGVGNTLLTCNRTQRAATAASVVAQHQQQSQRSCSPATRLCRLSRNRWLQKSKLSTHLLLHHLLDSL